jgi:HNH endonuclease
MAKLSIRERILNNISPEPNSGCWLWLGTCNRDGYSRLTIGDQTKKSGIRHASGHRISYEAFVGPIPTGLDIDHLCRVRCCVNPAHLEPVTTKVNVQRGVDSGFGVRISSLIAAEKRLQNTKCPASHEYDRFYSKGKYRFRWCSICWRNNYLRRVNRLDHMT